MKSGSLGNRPVHLDETNANYQVISINRKRKSAASQEDNSGAMSCVSGTCEVSWKPAQTAQADIES
jgi:hypothetical protein